MNDKWIFNLQFHSDQWILRVQLEDATWTGNSSVMQGLRHHSNGVNMLLFQHQLLRTRPTDIENIADIVNALRNWCSMTWYLSLGSCQPLGNCIKRRLKLSQVVQTFVCSRQQTAKLSTTVLNVNNLVRKSKSKQPKSLAVLYYTTRQYVIDSWQQKLCHFHKSTTLVQKQSYILLRA